MLKRTFIHLPGVGEHTEARFWQQGFHTWEDFLAAEEVPGLGRERLRQLRAGVEESLVHENDPAYFGPRLPLAERWRLFRRFRERAAYLDIETTGYTWPGLQVTVVGLYDGQTMRQDELVTAIRQRITIPGGTCNFDLPGYHRKVF